MKRYVFVPIVILMIGACSVDEIDPVAEEKRQEDTLIEFVAYIGEGENTKTEWQPNGEIWWNPDEEICIFYGNSDKNKFTSTNDEKVKKATFTGTLNAFTGETESGDFNYFWAVYPYDAAESCDGSSVVATLAHEQIAQVGTFSPNTNLTLAKSAGLSLAFYNVCAWFRFSVAHEGVKAVTFSGNNDEDVAGTFSVSMDGNNRPTTPIVSGGLGQKEIRLTLPNDEAFEVGENYYFTLLPQTFFSGFTLTFETDYAIGSRSVNSSVEFRRNVYHYGNSFDRDIVFVPKIISFADENVKSICVTNWDTNDDGELSCEEAAAVTSADEFKAAFGSTKTYTSFDEFQYFTGLTSIPNSMFEGWSITSIVLPKNITTIRIYAFSGCSSLTSIVIPDSVTQIGLGAFFGCSGLTTIDSTSVFSGCSSLSSVSIPDSFTTISMGFFSGCSSLTTIEIPEGLTSIGNFAFSGCSSLSSITIPDNVTVIGGNAFNGCSSLTSIVIPDNVTTIEAYTFSGCSNLSSITIPDGVTTIGNNVFNGCSSLSSITIPDGVTTIGNNAFQSCSSLSSIIIPDSVTTIGRNAFQGCSNLTTISISDSITAIDNNVFEDCNNLTSISIPSSVLSIGAYAFRGCSSLTSITIPDSVIDIGINAFQNCGLTTIKIPEGVTSIANNVFRGCTGLTSITIPEGVMSIGGYAFYECMSLTNITIPESVTSIGRGIFYCCYQLASVKILATIVPECTNPIFDGISNCYIYVPAESVDAYKTAEGWSEYADRITAIGTL